MKNTTKENILKTMGATFAVCSAVAIASSTKCCNTNSAKKTMKKTADKVVSFVDTVTSMM